MKAKKLLLSLLSVICIGFSAFVITSCGEHVHEWNEGEVTQEATCTVDGIKTYKCETCDETKTEVIYSKGHVEVIDEAVEATCTENGLTEGKHCSECNKILLEQEIIAAKGHNEVVDAAVNATCTTTGLTEGKHCSECNQTLVYQQVVPVKAHTEVIDEAVNATCTTTGLTEGKHCSECNQILVYQQTVSALSHSYTSVVTKPTCTEQGYTTHTCKTCSDSYVDSYVDALGHTEIIDEAVEATCTSTGLTKGKHCDVCGDILVAQEEVEKVKHIFENNFCTQCGCDYFTQDLKYSLSSNGTFYSVTRMGTSTDTDIVIPSTYNGLPVKSIGNNAFYNCRSLTSITIPDSVISIGSSAFWQCNSLTKVYYAGTIEEWCNIKFADSASQPMHKEAWFYMLNDNNKWYKVASIEIPNSITSIDDYKFTNFSSVTSIKIPDSVTRIGNDAFYGCRSLTSIEIPNSVTHIGEWAFAWCTSLTSVTIPDSVVYINDYAFYACSTLKNIDIPKNAFYIGSTAFGCCSSLKSIVIPDSVTTIGDQAFSDCSSLESITIPDNVTYIGHSVFIHCKSLKNIRIPDGVTFIGWQSFAGCSALTSIVIPDSVTVIENDAFARCRSLKTIYYTGTKEQWKKISIDSNGNGDLTNATIHYNYKG